MMIKYLKSYINRSTPLYQAPERRSSNQEPFVYITSTTLDEESFITSPQPTPLIQKLIYFGYFLAILAIMAILVLPGFFITKAMILEDPIIIPEV